MWGQTSRISKEADCDTKKGPTGRRPVETRAAVGGPGRPAAAGACLVHVGGHVKVRVGVRPRAAAAAAGAQVAVGSHRRPG